MITDILVEEVMVMVMMVSFKVFNDLIEIKEEKLVFCYLSYWLKTGFVFICYPLTIQKETKHPFA